jgi:hypothetical protein
MHQVGFIKCIYRDARSNKHKKPLIPFEWASLLHGFTINTVLVFGNWFSSTVTFRLLTHRRRQFTCVIYKVSSRSQTSEFHITIYVDTYFTRNSLHSTVASTARCDTYHALPAMNNFAYCFVRNYLTCALHKDDTTGIETRKSFNF